MSEMKENAICPISFIGGKIRTDKDINGLFMNPYNYKMYSDQYCGAMVEEIIRQQKDLLNPKILKSWKYDVQWSNERANNNALKSYLLTNISDLVRSVLIKFTEDVFFDKETFNAAEAEGFKAPNTHAECIGSMLGGCFESNINIEDEVKNAVMCSNFLQSFDDRITTQMIYVITDMRMSALYSVLVANIFERFIVDHVNVALTHQSLDQLYNFLYFKCFNKDPDELPGAQVEYSFCLSMMREIMDQDLADFRAALVCVSKNISLMIDQMKKSTHENNLFVNDKHQYDECYCDDDF